MAEPGVSTRQGLRGQGGLAPAHGTGVASRAVLSDTLITDQVTAQASQVREAMAFIHAHPELPFEEHQSADYLAALLQEAGLEVDRGIGGMPTAFRATIAGARAGRTIGLVAVYDAVPTVRADGTIAPVHSCGHGPQSAGVAGAALALAALRDQLAGSVVVLGLPADETTARAASSRGGGKEISVRVGLWDGIDAVLYAHPEFTDAVLLASLWMRQDEAVVARRHSLKDGSAQATLDSVRIAVERVRSALPLRLIVERAEFFGNIEEGCQLVLGFRFFADDESALSEMAQRLRSELPESAWRQRRIVPSIRADESVRTTVASAMATAGRGCDADPLRLPHATDFGYIAAAVPAALIGVSCETGWAMHTQEGAERFAGADGEEAAMAIARILALASPRLTEAV
jgi:metal-dependent amidase/aminoacylase/carboxypeptidase family protein